jgi:hypothetical protein
MSIFGKYRFQVSGVRCQEKIRFQVSGVRCQKRLEKIIKGLRDSGFGELKKGNLVYIVNS